MKTTRSSGEPRCLHREQALLPQKAMHFSGSGKNRSENLVGIYLCGEGIYPRWAAKRPQTRHLFSPGTPQAPVLRLLRSRAGASSLATGERASYRAVVGAGIDFYSWVVAGFGR
jgi:hypothetical protein